MTSSDTRRVLKADPMKDHIMKEFYTGSSAFSSTAAQKRGDPYGAIHHWKHLAEKSGLAERWRSRSPLAKWLGVKDALRRMLMSSMLELDFMVFQVAQWPRVVTQSEELCPIMVSIIKTNLSVNATHSCTSVKYVIFKEITILDSVTLFTKADLPGGYRQYGSHPVDCRFHVYCNGPNEHYTE